MRDRVYHSFFAAFRALPAVPHLASWFNPSIPGSATDSLIALPPGPLRLSVSGERVRGLGDTYGFTFRPVDAAIDASRTIYVAAVDFRIPGHRTRAQADLFCAALRSRVTLLQLADRHASLLPLIGELSVCETVDILHDPRNGMQMMGSQNSPRLGRSVFLSPVL